MKQKAKRILVVMLTVMIIFGYLAPLVADEANAASADLDLCELGCESEHCDGDHCDGGHYDEEINNGGHCDEEYCDGVICDGDTCDGDCHDEHCGDCECENGHCDEQCDVIGSEEVSSSSSVGRRAKAEAVCNHVWKTEVSKQPGCTTAGVYVTRCIKCRAYAQNGNGYITPLGHKWKRIVTKQPTCTMPGTYVNKCERCNMSTTGTISALGHALSWKYKTAPTETMPGVEEYSCNICGYVANVRYIPPLGNGSTSTSVGRNATVQDYCSHNYVLTVIKAATCTADGKKAYKCTKCQAQQYGAPTFTIPKLGHDYRQYTTKQPTCTAQGTYVTKCSRCGAGSQNGNGYIGALGHKWNAGSVTKSATCTATGTKTFTCTRCSGTKTESIAALGHSAGAAATCTAPQKCTRCNTTLKNALGHAWDNGTVTKAATCTATGVKTFKCSRCGGTRTETINALGHSAGAAATCTTPQKCTRCSTVINNALGHAWDNGTVTKAATCTATGTKTFKCTRCSATTTEAIPKAAHNCEWRVTVQASCKGAGTRQLTCKVCGTGTAWESIQYYGDHTWVAANCTNPKTCSVCGATSGSKLDHAYAWRTTVNPTCTTVGKKEQYCTRPGCTSVVNRQDVAALNHAWDNGTVTKAATCTETGINTFKCTRSGCNGSKTTVITALGHSWGPAATCTTAQTCTRCSTVNQKALGHDTVYSVTKEPTCTSQGTYMYKCTRSGCGYSAGNYIPALGHSWGGAATCTKPQKCTREGCTEVNQEALGHKYAWRTTEDATCTTTGRTERYCTREDCGHVVTRQYIQALGHTWDNGIVTKAPKCAETGIKTFKCTRCEGTRTETIEATGHAWRMIPSSNAASNSFQGINGYTNNHVLEATGTDLFGGMYFSCDKCQKKADYTEIQKADHYHEWILEKPQESTCTVRGYKKYHCDFCNETITVELPLADHVGKWEIVKQPAESKVGTEGYRCDSCGAIVENRECYLVVYDANEGSNPPASQIKYYDQKLTIAADVPKRQGYTFRGWAETRNATKPVVMPKGTYCANANLKLYAVWTINTYTITLKADEATNVPTSLKKNYDEDLVLPTPERSRYIFKGWSDSTNGTVKWAPGAKYTENASGTLYAIWEKYVVSVNRPKVTVEANGNRNGAPQIVKLMSNLAESFHARVENTLGGDDWLEVQVEGDTLKIWVDANLSGDGTRKAIVLVTNDSEAGCTVEVEQKGNYIRLKDEAGMYFANDGNQQIWFDEAGTYNGDGLPFFYVETLIDSYTCSVEYDEGTEAFLSVSALSDHIIIKCQPNEGYERGATLVLRSGNLVSRYRVVQQAKMITVSYRFVDFPLVSIKQPYGSKPLSKKKDLERYSIPESVNCDDVSIPLTGWIDGQGNTIMFQSELFEDISLTALYSKIQVFELDKNGRETPLSIARYDWHGKRISNEYLSPIDPQVMVKSYCIPKDHSNVEVLSPYSGDVWLEKMLCEKIIDKSNTPLGSVTVFSLKVAESAGEYVQVEDEEYLVPHKETTKKKLSLKNDCCQISTFTVLQEPPEVIYEGWDGRLTYYGISEEEFYSVYSQVILSRTTVAPDTYIFFDHTITQKDNVFVHKTDFWIVYRGAASIVASYDDGGNKYGEEIFVRKEQVVQAYDWLLHAAKLVEAKSIDISDYMGPGYQIVNLLTDDQKKWISEHVLDRPYEDNQGLKIIDCLMAIADSVNNVVNRESIADKELLDELSDAFLEVYKPQTVAASALNDVDTGIRIKYQHDLLAQHITVTKQEKKNCGINLSAIRFDTNKVVWIRVLSEDLWMTPIVGDTYTVK